MPDVEITARNVGGTLFATRIRGHVVFCDVPEELGGTDLGPLPPELFLASLANCFAMVAAIHCKDRGIPYQGMAVTVAADKAVDEHGAEYWTNLKLQVEMPPGIDEERLAAILRHARLACSVRGTVIREQDVETRISSTEE